MFYKSKIIFVSVTLFLLSTVNVFADSSHIKINEFMENATYQVFQNDTFLQEFESYSNALDYAKKWENATVVYRGVIWHNFDDVRKVDIKENKGNSILKFPSLEVYQLEKKLIDVNDFNDACNYAKKYANSFVYGKIILWDNYPDYHYYQGTKMFGCKSINEYLKAKKANSITSPLYRSCDEKIVYKMIDNCNHRISNVKCIAQKPQLPRGCEVTSLAMMLNYHGINVSKMTLAKEIKKIPYKEDPNKGFIGNMYNISDFGLGVYHSPIAELAEKYANKRVIDLTGCDFKDIYWYISQNKPVWVINNSLFNALGENYFQYWNTPSGKIRITYKEHSVLITGVDNKYVYINDPLTEGSRALNKSNFIKGWIQMGRQCVIID